MTNYEKIMSEMTVEELAEYMAVFHDGICGRCPLGWNGICDYREPCENKFKEWLNKEAETE